MSTQHTGGLKPTRRTLVKGAAWSVPVVAVAGTTPAYAASPPVVVEPDYSSGACKHPGNPKWYHFNFCFTNNSDEDVTVLLDSMTVNGVVAPQVLPASVVLGPGESCCRSVDGGTMADSANGHAVLSFSWESASGTGSSSAALSVDDLPPCGTGADPGGNPSGNPPHSGEAC